MLRFFVPLVTLLFLVAPSISADEAATSSAGTSATGLLAGDNISMFLVTKIGGAEDDGVETGATTCYRCKYGQGPMVMVFTRSVDAMVPKLVKALDAEIVKRDGSPLKAVVTLIGSQPDALTKKAEALAGQVKSEQVPIAVAKDSANGPASYQIGRDVAVTVLLVNYSQVIDRHDFAADKIDVAAVMAQVNAMVH